jgi:thiamine biosynthesis protein ThiS
MLLTVNGEVRETRTGIDLAAFLAQLGLDPAKVAVERNREIVPRSTYSELILEPDDRLEIVTFVGGG